MKVITVILLLIIGFYNSIAFAKNKPCQGQITSTVKPQAIQQTFGFPSLVLIPIDIKLSKNLAKCTNALYIEPTQNGQIQFKNGQITITGELLSEQKTPLKRTSYNGNKRWFLEANKKKKLRVWIKLISNELLPKGLFSTSLKIISEPNHNSQKHDSRLEHIAELYYQAPSVVSISAKNNSIIQGDNGLYKVELGNLTTGKKVFWGVGIISNSQLEISLSSERKALIHSTNKSDHIDYNFSFNGESAPAKQGTQYSYLSSPRNSKQLYKMGVEIGNADFKPAGRYEDRLILTVTAN